MSSDYQHVRYAVVLPGQRSGAVSGGVITDSSGVQYHAGGVAFEGDLIIQLWLGNSYERRVLWIQHGSVVDGKHQSQMRVQNRYL